MHVRFLFFIVLWTINLEFPKVVVLRTTTNIIPTWKNMYVKILICVSLPWSHTKVIKNTVRYCLQHIDFANMPYVYRQMKAIKISYIWIRICKPYLFSLLVSRKFSTLKHELFKSLRQSFTTRAKLKLHKIIFLMIVHLVLSNKK